MPIINSEWLLSFLVFADCMNFTRAAQRLHISQPALHVQIRKLAETLAVPLYVRRGRLLELTSQGRELVAFAREQQERTERLLNALVPGSYEPSVTLAAGEGTFLHLLPAALRTFTRSCKAKLRVLTRDQEQAILAVLHGEAQLAVTVVDEVPPALVARKLVQIGPAVVMPQSHRLARRRAVSISALAGEPLIVPPPERPLRVALAHAFAAERVSFSPSIEATGWNLMLCFAELGLGLAVVNDFVQAPRGMVKRPLRGLGSVQYQLLRLRDRKQSEATAALEQAIVSELSAQRRSNSYD